MIDWGRVAALQEEVGPEDFDEVVELFLQEVDEEIGNLAVSLAGADLQEKLHFLKGSALSLGFEDFSNLCQCGESALANDVKSDVDVAAIKETYAVSRTFFLKELSEKLPG